VTVDVKRGLKEKALSSTFWTGGDAFLRLTLKLGISVVLARLLSPQEFGTIALLYLFMDVANRFVDSGFSSALIQSQEVTHADESTVFWFTVISGAVVALALLAAAPVIAGVFSLPILIPLTEIMALGIFISALGSIQATLLTKKLDFRTQMKVGGIATIISGVTAITMAWRGYGVWSLAAQAITASAVTTMLLWFFSEWRPSFIFCRGAVKRYFGFGGFLLLSGLVDCLYRRA